LTKSHYVWYFVPTLRSSKTLKLADFLVEMKKGSTVRYLLVAGAPSSFEAIRIAGGYSVAFGEPSSARPVTADHSEPEPPISLYIAWGGFL
jgi:hypothetical protein